MMESMARLKRAGFSEGHSVSAAIELPEQTPASP
jgi:hypothetical protein